MNDIWRETKAEKDRIMDSAVLAAYAMLAITGRQEDEVSESVAMSLYGSTWVKDRTKRGLLNYTRTSGEKKSMKVYSRFEIECLKRAEKNINDSYEKALRAVEHVQTKLDLKYEEKD